MLREHSYIEARLYHLAFGDSTQVEPYLEIIKSLVEKLRKMGMPCQYMAALEEDTTKCLHIHVFLLVEAAHYNPDRVINGNSPGWLRDTAQKKEVSFSLYPPESSIHWGTTKDGISTKLNYATVPKTKRAKVDDCCEWISYLFKNRSKPDIRQIYFSSKPTRAKVKNT